MRKRGARRNPRTLGRGGCQRKGDLYHHPGRESSKITPEPEELPAGYAELLEWYREWCATAS